MASSNPHVSPCRCHCGLAALLWRMTCPSWLDYLHECVMELCVPLGLICGTPRVTGKFSVHKSSATVTEHQPPAYYLGPATCYLQVLCPLLCHLGVVPLIISTSCTWNTPLNLISSWCWIVGTKHQMWNFQSHMLQLPAHEANENQIWREPHPPHCQPLVVQLNHLSCGTLETTGTPWEPLDNSKCGTPTPSIHLGKIDPEASLETLENQTQGTQDTLAISPSHSPSCDTTWKLMRAVAPNQLCGTPETTVTHE